MHWPYTLDFDESFLLAQWGSALLLSAMLLFWQGSTLARVLLLVATWLAAGAVSIGDDLSQLGLHPGPRVIPHVLLLAATLGTFAVAAARRPVVALVAGAVQVPLWWLSGFVQASEGELSALHLAWIGLLVGILGVGPSRASRGDSTEPEREDSYVLHDTLIAVAAILVSAIVSVVVLHRRDGDADEWGYTFQAAVFAKARAYAHVPHCQHYFESMYVFEVSGRLFSQYTPGWPLFMVPFVWIRQIWLCGPFSAGLMAWGMARLGRSAARGIGRNEAAPPAVVVRDAGTWAALLATLATTVLTNAGSRFSHVYTLALYAWSLEALWQVSRGRSALPRRWQLVWGAVLGVASTQMVAVRPADGAFMGLGLALVFLWALAARKVAWRAFVGALGATLLSGALVLLILRLQVGRWFVTGYSLNALLRPWNVVKFSVPHPHEWKYGLPLATGAYCWWPVSVPLGLAGVAQMKRGARRLAVASWIGCVAYIPFCMLLDVSQRGFDWGYGPRYLMVLVVPLAMGCAVALAPLVAAAGSHGGARSALSRGGPLALAVIAMITAWVRIVPPEWATVEQHVTHHGALAEAVEQANLRGAIVLAQDGTTGFADMDLTTNLPIDLYPDESTLIATDRQDFDGAVRCLRAEYPKRRLYRASGRDDVHITPMD